MVNRFDTSTLNAPEVLKIINTSIDTQRLNEINYRIGKEEELKRQGPEKRNVAIGRMEITRWTCQDFAIWRNEVE